MKLTMPPVFSTYIVTNHRNGTLYTGHSDDRALRIDQHIAGTFDGFTRRYGCKHLVWYEEYETRHEAFTRERRIKEWKRVWKLELIEAMNPLWIDLHAVPHWPLPDEREWPELHARCLAHALGPGVRRGERMKKD